MRFGAASVSLPLTIDSAKETRRTRARPTINLTEDVGVITIGKVMSKYESVVSTE